jgi:AraC-like DNA-binding protein
MDERIEALMTLILADAQALRPDMFVLASEGSFLPMQDILDELDRGFADGFSLKDLSVKFHVSPGCLSAHFRHHVGMSPMQYVIQSRLTHAKVLLLKTELTVMEISMQCGYGDVSNFVRRFRQQFQMTPLQFRQQRKGHPMLSMPRTKET